MKIKIEFTHQGQTLLEVLVTLVVISMGVIALIRFQNYLAYDNSLVKQKSEAIILAVKQQEILRDYQVLNNMNGYISYQSIASGTSTFIGTTTSYTLTWTVTSNTNPTYKAVDITVSWTDRNNNAQSIRIINNIAGIDPANTAAVM